MTPKEKAVELINRFRMYDVMVCDLMGSELDGYEESHYKQCALIAVDEIIKSLDDVLHPNPFNQYWAKVEQEIKNL